jgi:DHA1 family bicyclomycin/chloramphenicol resistance-like MFS transporter
MTVYLLGFALSQLFYGPFSDRFGRRPLIMIAIGAFLVGSLICALSTDLYWLLLGRFVQSLGASGGMVISNAAIRDAFPLSGQTRMFIKVNAVFALAPAVGPIAGSLIDHYLGWQANFYLLAILAVLLMISVYFAFPETNRNRNAAATRPRILVRNYRNFFGHPDYLYHVVVLGLGIGIVYCSLVEAPHLVMVELGYPSKTFVVVSLSIVLGFMLGAGACAMLQKSIADTQLILVGLLIMLAGSLATGIFALLHWITLVTMLGSITLVYIGLAFVIPVCTARALAPFKQTAGAASAMTGCISMALASASTWFISVLPGKSPQVVFITFTLLTGTALALTLQSRRRLKPAKSGADTV